MIIQTYNCIVNRVYKGMEEPKLIQVRDIVLYSDMLNQAHKTADFLLAFRTHKIGSYHVIDVSHNQQETLDQLRTTLFGLDFKLHPLTTFPVVTWIECYDDYERYHQIAHTAQQLETCSWLAVPNRFGCY